MEYIVNARISNRHVHLTKEVYDLLFDEKISMRNPLNQLGEFASNMTVNLRNGDKILSNVRIVGPLRDYNQIEISKSDARILGLNPPVRNSSDLADSLNITLETPKNNLKIKGLIIANRHIHMNEEDAKKIGVKDKEIVKVAIPGLKPGIIDTVVKISSNGVLEIHIDTDDANAFLLEDNTKVKIIK